MKHLLGFILFTATLGAAQCLFIDGCPLFGCRPSGSFSFSQNIPRNGVSLNWINTFLLEPVPLASGCAADTVNIVCQSNGPFSEDKGYISLYSTNGTIRWRDKILTFPTMPILDNYGDVTGTDGTSLVHYDQDGKTYPIINVTGTAPVFNIQLVSTIYLLMVSQNGGLFVRDTSAIPVASIFLNDQVQRTNGTFIPIAQPVVNGSRFYVLTEFVPSSQTRDPRVLNLQRLYAIDIHRRVANIMTIAWFYNFEMENNRNVVPGGHFTSRNFLQNIRDDIRSKQNVMWDYSSQTAYISLPPPYKYGTKNAPTAQPNTFWALKDEGDSPSVTFRSSLDVTHMATFESDICDDNADTASSSRPVWLTTQSSEIMSISDAGNVTKEIDLNALMKSQVTVTSKMSLVRANNTAPDILVLGLKTQPTVRQVEDANLRFVPNSKTYVVAIDTVPENGALLWSVPVPMGLEVKGQISGSMGDDSTQKDQLVMYADDGDKTSKIFSLR